MSINEKDNDKVLVIFLNVLILLIAFGWWAWDFQYWEPIVVIITAILGLYTFYVGNDKSINVDRIQFDKHEYNENYIVYGEPSFDSLHDEEFYPKLPLKRTVIGIPHNFDSSNEKLLKMSFELKEQTNESGTRFVRRTDEEFLELLEYFPTVNQDFHDKAKLFHENNWTLDKIVFDQHIEGADSWIRAYHYIKRTVELDF